jgi:LacI family transcriptional regulator, galactose operon repressor
MAVTTMRDVAKRAEVSPSTVSHVLNGTRFVEPETALRVRLAIRELGYRPNLLARGLRRCKTHTIGLIAPNVTNPYWAELAHVVERAGYDKGYGVFLCNSNWSVDQEHEYVQMLLAKQIDGIVLASTAALPDVVDELQVANVPVVVIDSIPLSRHVNVVLVDNYRGGYLAGAYLLRIGHRQVGCITPPPGVGTTIDRVHGFRQAFAEADIELCDTAFIAGNFEYQSGERGVQLLLSHHPNVTAVYAANDEMAFGVIKGLHRAGRRVPNDVSVIGFDNISYTTLVAPELTTIAQPVSEIGQRVIDLLLKQINNPASAPEVVVLEPTLIERESCRAIRSP